MEEIKRLFKSPCQHRPTSWELICFKKCRQRRPEWEEATAIPIYSQMQEIKTATMTEPRLGQVLLSNLRHQLSPK